MEDIKTICPVCHKPYSLWTRGSKGYIKNYRILPLLITKRADHYRVCFSCNKRGAEWMSRKIQKRKDEKEKGSIMSI
tara:strand:- start:92 stop:322 length:231 start_codon:yes stop_codon:yes gene_type:complete